MIRLYRYQGAQSIAHAVANHPKGYPIQSVTDLERWIQQTEQQKNRWGLIEATFVIDQEGILCLADRHSEHVACAGGKAVRSAGEMFFASSKNGWEVRDVSNQSAGYCPEPTSWSEVAAALDQIPLPHPGMFTQVFLFRRCSTCRQLNLIKEQDFVCSLCDSVLPQEWNLEDNGEKGVKTMHWHNEPAKWTANENTITVQAEPGTDFWRLTSYRDNGHFYYQSQADDFQADVKFSGEYAATYDQAGLMVRANETTWIKCGIEYVDGAQKVSAVVTREFSDWSVVPLAHNPASLWLRLKRQGAIIEIYYTLDGLNYQLLRQAYFSPAESVDVGIMCASPDGTGFSVVFEDLVIRGA